MPNTSRNLNRNTGDIFRDTAVLTSQEVMTVSWSPEDIDDPNRKNTEVHIVATVFKMPGMAFVIRCKSRSFCQDLIAAITSHMDEVWPQE